MQTEVKLVWVTPDPEKKIGYCARVSNPDNQENENISKLIEYCYKNKHWSIFEMASMCLEITTSRAISPQILRHRSFNFQEFSGRYANYSAIGEFPFQEVEPRRQDNKNRQNSFDDLDNKTKDWFKTALNNFEQYGLDLYNESIKKGIAKECSRFFLPPALTTRLYMTGTIRSWIHYLDLRLDKSTQKEHRDVAELAYEIFAKELPIISEIMNNKK
jgi:thymidylate synthase (FAD)